MSAPTRSMAVAGAISLAAHAAVALAQSAAPSDRTMPGHAPTHPGTPQTPDALRLRGPEIAARVAGTTLVRRTFEGAIQRLGIDPGEAALDLLDLDDDARQRALGVLDRRAAALDTVVLDNLHLLTQIESAAEAGRMFRVLQIASGIHERFVDEVGREPLVDQLASVLPAHDAAGLRRLVEGYWDAIAHEEGGADVGRIEAFVIKRRAALEVFGKEVERALERVFSDTGEDDEGWEAMLAALDLSPEQEREIRSMGEEFYLRARLNPTKDEMAEFLTSVYLTLDEGQRTRLFSMVVSSEE